MPIWFETSETDETVSLSEKRWGSVVTDLLTDGAVIHNQNFELTDEGKLARKEIFWADEIKKSRDNPEERLKIAIKNLPLPAAFREAAIALRAKIRSKRKAKISFDAELEMLYLLAAIESFGIPYSQNLKLPGYNVLSFIPAETIKNLTFSFDSLGFENLELLKKTDKKLLIEHWGTPKNHSTLNELHQDVWLKFEKLYSEHQQKNEKLLLDQLSLTKIDLSRSASDNAVSKPTLWKWIILLGISLLLIIVLV